jgi:hypothetical protein
VKTQRRDHYATASMQIAAVAFHGGCRAKVVSAAGSEGAA